MNQSDNFKFTMPAEIIKGDNGEYRVAGLASTQSMDRQGETIIQKGIDLTPVSEGKSFFNWDHSNKPEDVIGTIDGYKKDGNGLYVHGRLFKGHQRAEAIYAIMKGLGDSKKGALGMSVEGKIVERDQTNPSVIKKCVIKNVAMTFCPVNSDTYAGLVKSMSESELEFDSGKETSSVNEDAPVFTASQVLSIVEKALSLGANAAAAPIARTGGDAMEVSNMNQDELKKRKKPRKMSKSMFKSSMTYMLDKLQELYPNNTRQEIWEAVKERLHTVFPDTWE